MRISKMRIFKKGSTFLSIKLAESLIFVQLVQGLRLTATKD
ncbi:hypothetical protein JCM19239_958 [Vibrio variabilis]|uniref:Uncharacterized protein n=1 Tax=Vibrio variabilis TaxID=990271 RepID=A0ABQ0JMG0_9VIBR|nr:hypothetical protein JCM19239_958 [Vibrio variabilis]